MSHISSDRKIQQLFQCPKCIGELQERANKLNQKLDPEGYAMLSIGLTDVGIQVWCNRHKRNVIHIDLEGSNHPANVTT